MNIIDKIQALKHYYELNRHVGHTFTTLSGAIRNKPCIIIANNMDMAFHIKKKYDLSKPLHHFISINNLDALRGHKLPIVFDNAALYSLFDEMLNYKSQEINIPIKIESMGWICPTCRKNLSPLISSCDCNSPTIKNSDNIVWDTWSPKGPGLTTDPNPIRPPLTADPNPTRPPLTADPLSLICSITIPAK